MIDKKRNIEINERLRNLYKKYQKEYLSMYIQKFKDPDPPQRINEFGIIDAERYDTDNGILFIAKETHGWSNEDYSNGIFFRSWLKDMTEHGLHGHASRHPLMWYNLGRWASLLNNPSQDISKLAEIKSISEIGTLAFTNINKVRGESSSGSAYQNLAHADITGCLLRKEIDIIQPKTIVCCGTYQEFIRHVDFNGKVIEMPHPGARIKTKVMLNKLSEQLKQYDSNS